MVDQASSKIFDLYRRYGNSDYIGEEVTQLEHAIQCAMVAEEEHQPVEYVLGALLHDIGHLVGHDEELENMVTGGCVIGMHNHEIIGEKFLQDLGVPEAVTDIVRGHVNAKRYLTFKDPSYHDRLSNASKMTLVHQGGPMSAQEAAQFEQHPRFEVMLKARTWDEKAKVANMVIDPLDKYEALFKTYMKAQHPSGY